MHRSRSWSWRDCDTNRPSARPGSTELIKLTLKKRAHRDVAARVALRSRTRHGPAGEALSMRHEAPAPWAMATCAALIFEQQGRSRSPASRPFPRAGANRRSGSPRHSGGRACAGHAVRAQATTYYMYCSQAGVSSFTSSTSAPLSHMHTCCSSFMIRVAAGEPLPFKQRDIKRNGHAMDRRARTHVLGGNQT
mgnify:CR=1 FL=1